MLQPTGAYRDQSIPIINVVFGALCWAALTACITIYVSRWNTARRQRKRWCAVVFHLSTRVPEEFLHGRHQRPQYLYWLGPHHTAMAFYVPFNDIEDALLMRCTALLVYMLAHACKEQCICVGTCVTSSCRSRRRRRLMMLLFTELVAQWVNVTFFLVPNIHLLIHRCSMFSTLVRECTLPAFRSNIDMDNTSGRKMPLE